MDLLQLTPLQLGFIATLIMGITEIFNRLRAKDYWVVATILTAALVGGLVGLYYHVDFISGITAGLSASGVLKGLSVLGNKTTPAPSDVLVK